MVAEPNSVAWDDRDNAYVHILNCADGVPRRRNHDMQKRSPKKILVPEQERSFSNHRKLL
jgi:hypothetical protein